MFGTHTTGPERQSTDQGSITPLVLGMMLCLLILAAGIIAAGSAFLGGQRIQRTCDGAANAGADALGTSLSYPGFVDPEAEVSTAINDYLALRGGDITASFVVNTDTVQLNCSAQVQITFGSLFGSPTLARTVTSTAIADYGFDLSA